MENVKKTLLEVEKQELKLWRNVLFPKIKLSLGRWSRGFCARRENWGPKLDFIRRQVSA